MPDLVAMLMVLMANTGMEHFSVDPESLRLAREYTLKLVWCEQCHLYHVSLLMFDEVEGLLTDTAHDDEKWLKSLRIQP